MIPTMLCAMGAVGSDVFAKLQDRERESLRRVIAAQQAMILPLPRIPLAEPECAYCGRRRANDGHQCEGCGATETRGER